MLNDRYWPNCKAIKARRRKKGWSQPQLADKAGYRLRTIVYAETGARRLNERTLRDIAGALGLPFRRVIQDDPPGSKDQSGGTTTAVTTKTTAPVTEYTEISIPGKDRDSFSDTDRQELLDALFKFLQKDGVKRTDVVHEIIVIRTQYRSVHLTVELPLKQARDLRMAINRGDFLQYGVAKARRVSRRRVRTEIAILAYLRRENDNANPIIQKRNNIERRILPKRPVVAFLAPGDQFLSALAAPDARLHFHSRTLHSDIRIGEFHDPLKLDTFLNYASFFYDPSATAVDLLSGRMPVEHPIRSADILLMLLTDKFTPPAFSQLQFMRHSETRGLVLVLPTTEDRRHRRRQQLMQDTMVVYDSIPNAVLDLNKTPENELGRHLFDAIFAVANKALIRSSGGPVCGLCFFMTEATSPESASGILLIETGTLRPEQTIVCGSYYATVTPGCLTDLDGLQLQRAEPGTFVRVSGFRPAQPSTPSLPPQFGQRFVAMQHENIAREIAIDFAMATLPPARPV